MQKFKIIIVLTVILTIFVRETSANELRFIPNGGLSQPVGVTSATWKAGYMIELAVVRPVEDGFGYGMRLGFNHWKPDAQELLTTNGREFQVERSEGWNSIIELSFLTSYRLMNIPAAVGQVFLEGGLGLFNVRRPDGYVKGFAAIGNSALNRDIFIKHSNQTKPGISAGFSISLLNRIRPNVRYTYIFTSEEATTVLMLGIGLLAH